MKKWFISLSVLVVVCLAGIYLLIPSQLKLSGIAYIHCPPAAAFRVVSEESKWPKWVSAGGDEYRIVKKTYNSLEVVILHKGRPVSSELAFLPLSADSLILHWQCSLVAGNNPFDRLARYKQATDIKKNMNAILQELGSFLSKTENVYGSPIRQIAAMDTALISTKILLPVYPSTPDVYRLVDTLKNYITGQGGKVSGPPIMNVTPAEGQFQLMVAVPTDRWLPETRDFVRRRMIPRAFIVSDVKGGDATVREAFRQMNLYFEDYKRIAMAIPFAALITDRTKESDTTRWMTRIYVPVY
ncbi:MAG TPA: hypothetical protein VGM41_03420 [Chitinophagaceae bacterium]|jgi:hypothetical protein